MNNFVARTQPLDCHEICLRAQAKSYFNSETNWAQKFPFNNDYIMRSEAELKRKWELQNSDKNKLQQLRGKPKKVKDNENET